MCALLISARWFLFLPKIAFYANIFIETEPSAEGSVPVSGDVENVNMLHDFAGDLYIWTKTITAPKAAGR